MKCKRNILIIALAVLVIAMANVGYALDVIVEPNNIQRKVGENVRVYLYATDAIDIISFGIQVSFNPTVLQADSANTVKNTDFSTGFVMTDTDAGGNPVGTPYTTPDIDIDNTVGTIFMMGGRLTGASTLGLNGTVLLGWITFDAIANGNSNILIDLGKVNTNHGATFANFVGLGGTLAPVYDDTIGFQSGTICVMANACSANFNPGEDLVVNTIDFSIFRAAFGKTFPDSGFDPLVDLNADGIINTMDFSIFRSQFGTLGCPVCP